MKKEEIEQLKKDLIDFQSSFEFSRVHWLIDKF